MIAPPSMLFLSGLGFGSEPEPEVDDVLATRDAGRAAPSEDTASVGDVLDANGPGPGPGSGSCRRVAIRFALSSRMFPVGGSTLPSTGFVLALALLCPVTNDLNVLLVGARLPLLFLLDPVKDEAASIVDGVCGRIEAFASAPSSSPGWRYSSWSFVAGWSALSPAGALTDCDDSDAGCTGCCMSRLMACCRICCAGLGAFCRLLSLLPSKPFDVDALALAAPSNWPFATALSGWLLCCCCCF